MPGGWAAQLYGGDKMLSMSFFCWSLASLLTPGSAANGHATIAARVVVGVSQGFLIPAVHTGELAGKKGAFCLTESRVETGHRHSV